MELFIGGTRVVIDEKDYWICGYNPKVSKATFQDSALSFSMHMPTLVGPIDNFVCNYKMAPNIINYCVLGKKYDGFDDIIQVSTKLMSDTEISFLDQTVLEFYIGSPLYPNKEKRIIVENPFYLPFDPQEELTNYKSYFSDANSFRPHSHMAVSFDVQVEKYSFFLLYYQNVNSNFNFFPIRGSLYSKELMSLIPVTFFNSQGPKNIDFKVVTRSGDSNVAVLEKQETMTLVEGIYFNILSLNQLDNLILAKLLISFTFVDDNYSFEYNFNGISKTEQIQFPFGYQLKTNMLIVPLLITPTPNNMISLKLKSIFQGEYINPFSFSSSNMMIDVNPPIVSIKSVGSFGVFQNIKSIELNILDTDSAVYEIKIGSYIFRAVDCLVFGTLNNGDFEITLDLTKQFITSVTPTVIVSDIYGNSVSVVIENFSESRVSSFDDIVAFEFLHGSIDTSIINRNTQAFLKIKNMDPYFKPVFTFFDRPFKSDPNEKFSFVATYQQDIDMYQFNIQLPNRPNIDSLEFSLYIAPFNISNYDLQSKFGDSAILKFHLDEIDVYPPMVTEMEIISDNEFDDILGWYLTISDTPTGLYNGSVKVISNYDGEPRVFVLSKENRVSGNEFVGKYKIAFEIQNQIQQTFFISEVILFDMNGRVSKYPPELHLLSPFIEISSSDFKVKNQIPYLPPQGFLEETISPILVSFTTDHGEKNLLTIKFQTKDAESGISTRHNPYIYIKGFMGHVQIIKSNIASIDEDGKSVSYKATATLDYELSQYGCYYFIYGITDNHLNTIGMDVTTLQVANFDYYYKNPILKMEPIIESYSRISQLGGYLTIYGNRFVYEATKETTSTMVMIDNRAFTPEFISPSLIVLNIPSSFVYSYLTGRVTSFDLSIQNSFGTSNIITISPKSFSRYLSMYVDPESTCASGCGSFHSPYSSIKSALSNATEHSTIILKDGMYRGSDNVDIEITSLSNIIIRSINGFLKTKIDCESYSLGFSIIGVQAIGITGITFMNCVSNKGGAFYIQDSSVLLTSVQFLNNLATNGGAVYSSRSDITILNSVFYGNKVINNGAAIYSDLSSIDIKGDFTRFSRNTNRNDKAIFNGSENNNNRDILCKNSTITVDSVVSLKNAQFSCVDGCDYTYKQESLCSDGEAPKDESLHCISGDSCLINSKCPCYFSGMVLEEYEPGCRLASEFACQVKERLPLPEIKLDNFMGGMTKFIVKIYGFVSIKESKYVDFTFYGSHFGFLFKLDRATKLSFSENSKFNETISIPLSDKQSHYIEILLFSNHPNGGDRLFNLAPFKDSSTTLFYSNQMCNDGIRNQGEKDSCDSNLPIFNPNSIPSCGDKICNETPNSCFQDCFDLVNLKKSQTTIVSKKLPGTDQLSFGLNVFSVEESQVPIFDFDYSSSETLKHPLTGIKYHIPKDFINFAIYPQCTYSPRVSTFLTLANLKNNLYSEAFSGETPTTDEAKKYFSLEKTVVEYSRIRKTPQQAIVRTDLYCKTSFIELDLDNIHFHANFLKQLDSVKVVEDMVNVLKKYGNHVYKSTYLGGKVSQMALAEPYAINVDLKDRAAKIFSNSIVTPVFSMTTPNDVSLATSITMSRLFNYGGKSASFSPSTDSKSSPLYQEWSTSLNTLPAAIQYTLYPIQKLLDKKGFINSNGVDIAAMWAQANTFYVNSF
ncbi:hypothetical protein CYY_009272 [Polysphondylium violaceum]|uniref:MACPF domain-containing protein n=1 Tax=Polysphondylium violaceum TaxID=133409 RepID=A0A8J4V0M1_9MYCE|nr:hypothetical protein CYY_009272 [Polysphondylium violaceum]